MISLKQPSLMYIRLENYNIRVNGFLAKPSYRMNYFMLTVKM